MMTAYTQLQTRLATQPHTWLITGVAGFIGSNLLETLLKLNQRVVGLDNQADMAEISPFQPGCMVRLRAVGLQGLQGMVHSVSVKRVTLLLEILGRQKLVAVEHHQVELV